MAKNFEHIIHKNSSALVDNNPKLPTSGQLEYGEIAINYAKDKETISLKNSNNEIVTFTSDKKLDNYVTVSDFDENELIVSAALNDLEESKADKDDLTDLINNVYTKEEIDNNHLVISSSLNDLNTRLNTKQNTLVSGINIKTINNQSILGSGNITLTGVPAFSASDNGKILGVVNGQLAWVTPTTIYTGSGTPSSSTDNDGDIYLQTS